MSDINFCNTKEQLNHLGEVVTGKVDGSPTGADINTSTLPYTGQVRKTLPALEAEYLEAIQSTGGEPLNGGVWASGQTFTAYNQYMIYANVPYKPKEETILPYGPTGAAPDFNFVQPYSENDYGTVISGIQVKHRRGTAAEIAAGTPAIGELWFNTTDNSIHMGDGATISGHRVPTKKQTIVNVMTISDAVTSTTIKAGYALKLKDRTPGDGATSLWDVVLASSVTPNGGDIVSCTGVPTLALVLRKEEDTSIEAFGSAESSLSATNQVNYRKKAYVQPTPITGIVGSKFIGNGEQETSITCADTFMDSSGNRIDALKIKDLELLGPGIASGIAAIKKDGTVISNRETYKNLRIRNFGTGIDYSAGWNQDIDQNYITGCDIGFKTTLSPILAGWASSGFTFTRNYIASCNVGIELQNAWNFTSINSVIEDCDLPINQTASATPSVWINTWFESNKQSPRLTYSNIFIGGRLEGGEDPVAGFYDNMSLPIAPFDSECITEINQGVSVFRDPYDRVFRADGQGVKAFKPSPDLGWDIVDTASTAKGIQVGYGSDAVGGGLVTTSWGNDAATPKKINGVTGARHLYSYESVNVPQLGLHIYGEGSTSLTGLGYVTARISTGIYESGGAGATNYGERWEWNSAGHFNPLVDGSFDIGSSASNRVKDLRIVNAPIVGSDVRIKPTIENIPQQFLDFVMSTEIKQYKLHGGKRYHYGIVITEEFRNALQAVYDIDDCAALCLDVFKDSNGNPIEQHLFGETNTVEYTGYINDKLIIDVDNTRDFTLKIGDEILATSRGGVLDIRSDKISLIGEQIGLSHVYTEQLPKPKEIVIGKGESEDSFKKRHAAYLIELELYKESSVDTTPITTVTYGGVILNDLWQVRYDEWQNILLEAMRRKIIKL